MNSPIKNLLLPALLLATPLSVSAQVFFGETPYTNVVPGVGAPYSPNQTNLNVNYWSTGAGWADSTASLPPGLSIVSASNTPSGGVWSTTDPYDNTNFTGDVGVLQTNTFTRVNGNPADPATGGQSFNLGGLYAGAPYSYVPGTTNPSYYKSFAPVVNTNIGAVWTFAEFAIVGPSGNLNGSFPAQDSFGFSLWSGAPGAGTNISSFLFGKDYAVGSAATNPDKIGFAWFVNGAQQTTNGNPALTGDWAIEYNANYRLNASIDTNNLLSLSLDTLNGSGVFQTNTLFITNFALPGGLTYTNYDTIAMDWQLSSGDPNDPGANFMNVNTVEVVTTPEPSTYALLGMAAAAALWWRGRKRGDRADKVS